MLAGWPAFPWGQLGTGPVPPTLDVLKDLSVDRAKVEALVDTLFHLDSASPPMLRQGQRLRIIVHTSLASMIMYMSEREEAGEAKRWRSQ